jgi:hypothetical protein
MQERVAYQVPMFLEVNGLKMITSRNVKHGLAWNVEQSMDEIIPIQRISIILQELNSKWHVII